MTIHLLAGEHRVLLWYNQYFIVKFIIIDINLAQCLPLSVAVTLLLFSPVTPQTIL